MVVVWLVALVQLMSVVADDDDPAGDVSADQRFEPFRGEIMEGPLKLQKALRLLMRLFNKAC